MNKFATAMDEGQFYVGKICTDCLMVIANGDASGNADDWDKEEFDRVTGKYDIVLGHPHFNMWYDKCHHNGHACDIDCDCARDEFSTSECDVCGDQLHGTRHDIVMIEWSLLK